MQQVLITERRLCAAKKRHGGQTPAIGTTQGQAQVKKKQKNKQLVQLLLLLCVPDGVVW